MVGRGGGDQQAREDMFPSRTTAYRDAPLLATTRTGADDKFDPSHPFYRLFARLGHLRAEHAALRTGAMVIRPVAEPAAFAFSRFDRNDRVEYVAVFNSSRTAALTVTVPTSQPAGATLARLFDSRSPDDAGLENLPVDANGGVRVTVAPLQFSLWRATAALPIPASGPGIALVTPASGAVLSFTSREIDDLVFPSRREIRVEVTGGDGLAEVTFVLTRASRPGEYELLGVDDTAPYRVFWSPPADLAPGEKLSFTATVNDLRGHTATSRITDLTVAPASTPFGIPGAKNPRLTAQPPADVSVVAGTVLDLRVSAEGSGALEYQWYRADEAVPGATATTFRIEHVSAGDAGRYRVVVHNLAGTTLGSSIRVVVVPK